MRYLIFLLFLIFSLCTVGMASAYYDDSVIIEIGDVAPPEPEVEEETNSTGGTGSAESTAAGGSTTGDNGGGTGNTGNGAGSSTGTNSNNTTSNGSSGGSSTTGSTGTSSTTDSNTTSPENTLLDILITSGAITVETGGSGGSATPQGVSSPSTVSHNTSESSASTEAAPGAQGAQSGTVTLNASKIRDTLRQNTSFGEILGSLRAGIQNGTRTKRFSQNEVRLLGASAILDDSRIDQIVFGATRFEIVYRSRGYLLGFIPKKFPVRIVVDPQAALGSERVVITLPWYRFFVRKLFIPSALSSEINEVIANSEGGEDDDARDVQARLFDAVTTLLNHKIGTVGESVRKN